MENIDVGTGSILMQKQQTQNLLPTKERPELNPILSALINEDVMKSIEAKRAIENQYLENISAGATENKSTEGLSLVLTTPKALLDEEVSFGLIDQRVSFEAAGSENNQQSRIQIKKGPNGMDYEYEYVYYYYDDDDGAENKNQQEAESTIQETSNRGELSLERGKSRYTNIERSTTYAPDNALINGKTKSRSNLAATRNSVEDGRLPVMTRFPIRGKIIENNPADSLASFGNINTASIEKSKKISLKRPSLELVDSETFNTDETQSKGSPRYGDSGKKLTAVESEETTNSKNEEKSNEKMILEDFDQTTPLMQKAVLDLYAILARENLEMDITTDVDDDMTTDSPETTEYDDEVITTTEIPTDTVIPTISSYTSTTTTTETPTTTPSTTTPTTTTANTNSLFGTGRRGIATPERNRFRLKSVMGAGEPTSTTLTQASAVFSAEEENASRYKERNRFQRPSFSSRKIISTASSTAAAVEEQAVSGETDKNAVSLSPVRGKTRNRFHMRGQLSTTTIGERSDNDYETYASSTTTRPIRARPTLTLRGRNRIGARPTASSQAIAFNKTDEASSVTVHDSEASTEKTLSTSLPTKSSRFNLSRAGGSSGMNRLSPRSRVNSVRVSPTPVVGSEDINSAIKEESENENSGKAESATIAALAVGGLNKLKVRPRLQIQSKIDNKSKSLLTSTRKVNPLLARRKLAFGSSTTDTALISEEHSEVRGENNFSSVETRDADVSQFATDEVTLEENTEIPETTTKQVRGLGLLTQRKRLQIRKPGTLL